MAEWVMAADGGAVNLDVQVSGSVMETSGQHYVSVGGRRIGGFHSTPAAATEALKDLVGAYEPEG